MSIENEIENDFVGEELVRPSSNPVNVDENEQQARRQRVAEWEEKQQGREDMESVREIKASIGLRVSPEEIKQIFLKDFTNKERDELVYNFKKAMESQEDTKLVEKNISENLAFVVYKGAKKFGGGIMFRLTEGEDIKAQITFNPEENDVLNMVHREVQSQYLGIGGSAFLKKTEECFEILQKAEILPSDTTFMMEAGQVEVVQWALKNGYSLKNSEQEKLFNAIVSRKKNDEYIVIDFKEGGLYNNYIFQKDVYKSKKQELNSDPSIAKDYSVRFVLIKNIAITDIGNKLNKMEKIDLEQYRKVASPRLRSILDRFPEEIQREFADERPIPSDEDIEELDRCTLNNENPIEISLQELLKNQKNRDSISRAPKEVVNKINETWNVNIPSGKVYDENPARYFEYSKMNGGTAKPSVMVNGAIVFGVARFIAALLRKDKNITVWDIERVE